MAQGWGIVFCGENMRGGGERSVLKTFDAKWICGFVN